MTNSIVLILNRRYWDLKFMFKHQKLEMFGLKLNIIRNAKKLYFYSLQVVCRGSETQLEVGKN